MQYRLQDINLAVVAAWTSHFANCPDVTVSHGDIFSEPADAVVSPANSFGFMDGAIDLAYSMRFGWDLQARLQSRLREAHDGELPVGQAVIVPTDDPSFPWLISAPTMRVPMDVSGTVNAFLAFRAVIRSVRDHNRAAQPPIRSIVCPGLGTAVGRMAPASCAKQMYAAYRTAHLGETFTPSDLMEACRNQWDLAGPPARRAV
jgi:O-acetyl-ADP-ribose deacetylase (regulator of RNase III)